MNESNMNKNVNKKYYEKAMKNNLCNIILQLVFFSSSIKIIKIFYIFIFSFKIKNIHWKVIYNLIHKFSTIISNLL